MPPAMVTAVAGDEAAQKAWTLVVVIVVVVTVVAVVTGGQDSQEGFNRDAEETGPQVDDHRGAYHGGHSAQVRLGRP